MKGSTEEKDMTIIKPVNFVKVNIHEAPPADYDISEVASKLGRDVSDVLSLVSKGKFEQPAKNGRWTIEQIDRYIETRNEKLNKRSLHGDR